VIKTSEMLAWLMGTASYLLSLDQIEGQDSVARFLWRGNATENGDLRESGDDKRQECEAGDVYPKYTRYAYRPFLLLDRSPLPRAAAALARTAGVGGEGLPGVSGGGAWRIGRCNGKTPGGLRGHAAGGHRAR